MSVPTLAMETRGVSFEDREIVGVVAPYGETSYLVPYVGGERICRGAFTKSIEQRQTKVPLVVGHGRREEAAVGMSRHWEDGVDGLTGRFYVKPGPVGDQVLEDARGGYYGGLSVEFAPVSRGHGADGASEIRQARLIAVALVATPAYEGAVLARDVGEYLRRIPERPKVDLSPIPAVWLDG